MLVHIDFETRCDLDITKVGTSKYTSDPSFEILCAAFIVEDKGELERHVVLGNVRTYSLNDNDSWLRLIQLAGNTEVNFVAHGSQFEYNVWENYMVRRLGMPSINLNRWLCTMACSMQHALPRSLDDVSKALGLSNEKSKEGSRLMKRMCKRDSKTGRWVEDSESMRKLVDYCVQDTEVELDIHRKLGKLTPSENRVFRLDSAINNRGIPIDVTLVKSGYDMYTKAKDIIKKECLSKTGISPSQVAKFLELINSKGLEIKDLKASTVKECLANPNTPDDVKELLLYRRDYSNTSLSKLKTASLYDQDSTIRGQFVYHGATTGRFSGKGVQFHNLPRGVFDEDKGEEDMNDACSLIINKDLDGLTNRFPKLRIMDALKSSIRGVVKARQGRILRVVDYSQIEARVLPWLSGQQDVLDAFINGKDLYKHTATGIYNKPYDEIDKQERFVGKTASLALQYQGGHKAFMSMALNYGVLVEEDDAVEAKVKWRKANSKIVKFWYDLQKACIRVVESGKKLAIGKHLACGVEGDFMYIQLPSNRRIYYYKPEVKQGDYGKSLTYMGSDQKIKVKWGRISGYGGKLAENVTQAVSRDILTDAMLKLDREGFNIIMHVHDECVTHDKKNFKSLEDMIRIMKDVAPCYDGLPVDADGFEAERYRK